MKNLTIHTAVLCLSLFLCLTMKSASPFRLHYDTLSCLQIEGKITNFSERESDECVVELINGNEVERSIVLKEGKSKFRFVLNKDAFYAIRITKAGFATKLISINTEILTENHGIYVFKFETSLLSEKSASRLNQEYVDFPVTIINFDYEKECFNYNHEYTAYIKRQLYQSTSSRIKTPRKLGGNGTKEFASAQ